jgi:Concanavalin A-like lectin/glucanases superfamily
MDTTSGPLSYILGKNLVSQILLTIVVMLAAYSVITIFETVVTMVRRFNEQTTVLFADTTPGKQLIVQKPDASALIYNSQNELNGMELSYSMYLNISPDTFEARVSDECGVTSENKPTILKHIMHKGSKDGFPLMAPGLFVEGNKNTLRLYMNSTTRWDNYVEIPNIPIGKWFHLVVVLKGKYLDVYVNGNVTVRHQFDVVPKLNFGNVYVLYPIKFPRDSADKTIRTKFTVDNAAKGMVSRLKYYAYALNYAQIDTLYREGPSKTIVSNTFTEVPPYFHDDWWVTQY